MLLPSAIVDVLVRALATSQASPLATLVIAIWAGVWPPWVIALVIVHFVVVMAMRTLGPIADTVGFTRATLIRRQVEDPAGPPDEAADDVAVTG